MASFGQIASPTPAITPAASLVENYFVSIDELSAHNTASAHEETTVASKSPIPAAVEPLLQFTPFILFALLFVVAYGVLVINRAKSLKNMTTALVIALITASIPAVLTYIDQGSRQTVKAGPEEVPRSVMVRPADPSSVVISWTTDAMRTGAVRFDTKPLKPVTAQIYIANAQSSERSHTVTIDRIVRGQTYEFEILSGTTWYDNAGSYIQFTSK